jgi:hypothetical protein
MTQIFNSKFEVATRLLLQLYGQNRPLEKGLLMAYDFLTIYGKSYGFLDENLNGDSPMIKAEIQHKMADVERIYLNSLVSNGFVNIVYLKSGIGFETSEQGKKICESLSCDYALKYLKYSRIIVAKTRDFSSKEIINLALKGGVTHD